MVASLLLTAAGASAPPFLHGSGCSWTNKLCQATCVARAGAAHLGVLFITCVGIAVSCCAAVGFAGQTVKCIAASSAWRNLARLLRITVAGRQHAPALGGGGGASKSKAKWKLAAKTIMVLPPKGLQKKREQNRISRYEESNMHLAKVYIGTLPPPFSWDLALQGVAQMLALPHMSPTEVDDLSRIIAHCDIFASGRSGFTNFEDITERFEKLQEASSKGLQRGAGRERAINLGLGSPLPIAGFREPPRFNAEDRFLHDKYGRAEPQPKPAGCPHQSGHVYYLRQMDRWLRKFVYKTNPWLNATEVIAATMLIHSTYVDRLYQARVRQHSHAVAVASKFERDIYDANDASAGGGQTEDKYKAMPPLSLARALAKVCGKDEYYGQNGMRPGAKWAIDSIAPCAKGDPKVEQFKTIARACGSVGCVFDWARCSYSTDTKEEQVCFIDYLCAQPGGEFEPVQQQTNHLDDPEVVGSQRAVNVVFTPLHQSGPPWQIGQPMTFHDMLQDNQFTALAEAARRENQISGAVFAGCMEVLGSSRLKEASIGMITELRLRMNEFHESGPAADLRRRVIHAHSFCALTTALRRRQAKTLVNNLACSEEDSGHRRFLQLSGIDAFAQRWDFTLALLVQTEFHAIARLMARNKSVTKLNLTSTGMGDQGAQFIARSLVANSTLQELNLNGNRIGDEGAQALGHAIANNNNTTLLILHLQNNEITTAGALGIASGLDNNRTLTWLYLDHNKGIGKDGKVAVRAAWANRTHHLFLEDTRSASTSGRPRAGMPNQSTILKSFSK